MSDRERWIVYPLLFLALGASLRDKLIKQTTSKQVFCEQLTCGKITCGQVDCSELQVKHGNQTIARLKGDTLDVRNVRATSVLQNGQPVLGVSPFQQLLKWLSANRAQPQPPAPAP